MTGGRPGVRPGTSHQGKEATGAFSLAVSHRFHISPLCLMAARALYLCLLLCLSLVFCGVSAFSNPQLYKDMQRPHVVNPPWLSCPNECEVRVGKDCKWDYKKCGGIRPISRPDTGGLAA
ncbi:hypothetical protein Pcinc_027931 [Petrolisthes cinctipes]|uniref:Uncharacterized protein n=1 Tax=Petrolisthes cinctipes TaxID=88211 RepID=A0AAE1F452_PETCI|nr:hypothetical protein Pcinc_027931 [Petrolisthes cinctipes]